MTGEGAKGQLLYRMTCRKEWRPSFDGDFRSPLILQVRLPDEAPKQRLHPLAKRWLDAAGEVDLAVQRRKQLDGLQTTVVLGKTTSVAHKFVSEVFERVAEFLQTTPGFGRNPAPDDSSTGDGGTLVERLYAERGTTISLIDAVDFHVRKVSSTEGLVSLRISNFGGTLELRQLPFFLAL